MKGTIPALCGHHHSFQPLLWVQQVARHVTFTWAGWQLETHVCAGLSLRSAM